MLIYGGLREKPLKIMTKKLWVPLFAIGGRVKMDPSRF